MTGDLTVSPSLLLRYLPYTFDQSPAGTPFTCPVPARWTVCPAPPSARAQRNRAFASGSYRLAPSARAFDMPAFAYGLLLSHSRAVRLCHVHGTSSPDSRNHTPAGWKYLHRRYELFSVHPFGRRPPPRPPVSVPLASRESRAGVACESNRPGSAGCRRGAITYSAILYPQFRALRRCRK